MWVHVQEAWAKQSLWSTRDEPNPSRRARKKKAHFLWKGGLLAWLAWGEDMEHGVARMKAKIMHYHLLKA